MKRIPLSSPHMGPDERELLVEAFDSNWVAPLGPHVDAFEAELAAVAGVPHACALASGTAGLHLALVMLGVGPGDEVITSTLTFAATTNAISYTGARPVFVDSSRDSWNMDPELFAAELDRCAKVGKLPKAAVVVDLYGQSADWDPIVAACQRHGVPLIEDAAEALGATYKGAPCGSFGDMAVFSFNGNKIITTSGGGMLVSRHKSWTDRARFLATQARDPAPHYQHSTIGYNYRLSNLLAAVGRGQLRHLEDRVSARRANFVFYQEALGRWPGVKFMPEPAWGRSTRWLSCLTVDSTALGVSREDIRLHLDKLQVECRPVWKPMHLQPVFAGCRTAGGEVSEDLFTHGLCLPSGSNLTDADRMRILEGLESVPGLRLT
jgi:dTDP-4-amino-4,6-dideoxygalactose transaminase